MSPSPPPMTREVALRIGLASRALAQPGAAALAELLRTTLGLPLTETKLAALGADGLRALLAAANLAAFDRVNVAAGLLLGVGVAGSALPPLEAGFASAGSIRVAVASNHGEWLDGHFGSCERFLVYQLSPLALRLIDLRPTLEADHMDERNAARAALIGDCQLVYVQSIGGPAAAKVVRAGVHPIKVAQAVAARDLLARLQETLLAPPPWLARAMGVKAASLDKFVVNLEES